MGHVNNADLPHLDRECADRVPADARSVRQAGHGGDGDDPRRGRWTSARRSASATRSTSASGRADSGRRASTSTTSFRCGDTVAASAKTVLVAYDYREQIEQGDTRRMATTTRGLVFERRPSLTASAADRRCRTCSRRRASSCSRPARGTRPRRRTASPTSPSTCSSRERSVARRRGTSRGGRLDRRRVQRLHRQGVHGLLREVRVGARVTGCVRRPRRHDAHSRFEPRRSSARRA